MYASLSDSAAHPPPLPTSVPQLSKIPLIIQITLTPAWPAEGQTLSTNAAVEPEIIDLMDLLKEMATNSKTEVNKKQITIVIHGGCCFI